MGAIVLKLCLFVIGPVVGLKVIQSPPVLDLNISWIVEGDVSYQTEPDSLTVNRDNTYNLSSRLQITDTHRDQGTAVICEVQHITHSELSIPVIIRYLIIFVGISLLLTAMICVQIFK
ncbi:hypothetical protein scyTo_0009096 [Scyliorhinus torazame]|uniref:Immunoglobulin C1-set domain-containing protein n=1 Tax=Scyliorhinus torazame TaxID=75743 RepID=A0A401NGH2_SCYTO|nr:hypothetical protein [Scyliorhinus torazame]